MGRKKLPPEDLTPLCKPFSLTPNVCLLEEEAVVLANVAERAERYEDMVDYMKAEKSELFMFVKGCTLTVKLHCRGAGEGRQSSGP